MSTRCELCDRLLSGDRKGDYWCSGCETYICDEHPGDPWGNHEPSDHEDEP